MADRWGQLDNQYSGAADIWDDRVIGPMLLADYFEIITPTGHVIRVWMGSSWDEAVATVWNGAAWITGTVRVWNGAEWL